MSRHRYDMLSECTDGTLPIDVFQEKWCSRCMNLECTRSIAGKSRFEQRVSEWEERLFTNPPRMSPDDPRFGSITAQKFITLDPGRTPEITSAWLDPRDLTEAAAPAHVPSPPPIKLEQAPALSTKKDTGTPQSTLAPPVSVVLTNAPDQSGKLLQGAPSGSTTRRDPWASPESSDSSVPIVSPGATVKMPGSGV